MDNEKIKTPIFKIVVFVAIFILLFIKASYFVRPVGIDRSVLAGFYAEEKNTLDMIYIGGSAAFVYYEPLEVWNKYGITSYNYAANTIQAEVIKYSIIEVLKTQKPKLIVIDARPFQYRDKDQPPTEVAIRNFTDSMPYSLNRFNLINTAVIKELNKNPLSYYFDIIKYHNVINTIDKKNVLSHIKWSDNKEKNAYKGFYFITKYTDTLSKPNIKTAEKTPVSQETYSILNDLLDYCKSTDINYLFVVSPYEQKEAEKKVFNYIGEAINKAGYDFLDANDYYDSMKLDFKKDFYHYAHVNIFGAEKYTNFLANYIVGKYQFVNKKSDPAYSSWNDLYIPWSNTVNTTKTAINSLIKDSKK